MIPDMPKIEGLQYRSVLGEQDANALYAVHTGRARHDQVDLTSHHEYLVDLDGLRRDLTQAAADGKQDQWLVAQVADRVVGYSQLISWPDEDGTWVYFITGWVLPEWCGQGIGTSLLHWGEDRARQLAALEHPNERFEFAANASSTEHDAMALLQHEGYFIAFTTLEMHFDLSKPFPAVYPIPAGFELRPVLPEHYPQIISSVIECYLHEFPGNRFRSKIDQVAYYSAEYSKPKYDPKFMYVAWDGEEIAGQVFLVIQNDEIKVAQVSVRPAWRRRGLARALLTCALWDVRGCGARTIWLFTHADNPTRAVDLYRSLGFYVAKVFPRYRKTP